MTDDKLIERFNNGETYREIAKAAGVHDMTIAARIKKLRKEQRLPYRRDPLSENHPRRILAAKKDALVRKLHAEGLPVEEIAERAKLSPGYVRSKFIKGADYTRELELIDLQLNA